MEAFHRPVSFGPETDGILEDIEKTETSESYKLLGRLKKSLRSNVRIITHLALASSKWVDHSGPLVGHGILNADPILRSMDFLPETDRDIPLVQTTMYVLELLRNPNYGPYSMQEIKAIKKDSEDQTQSDFSKAVRSGHMKHTAEKLLAGLITYSPKRTYERLLYEGLVQYGENEHRILLPYHTLKLIERSSNRNYAVPLLRPTVQYLSTCPDVSRGMKAEQMSKQVDFNEIVERGDKFDQENVYDITRMLLNSALGNEMTVIVEYSKSSSVPEMYEAIALASTMLLLNSDLEHHSVTGKHCILSILRDEGLHSSIRTMALLSSMEGPRARRLKSYLPKSLDNYLKKGFGETEGDEDSLLEKLRSSVMEGKQDASFDIAAEYVRSGHNADRLAGSLISLCFHTEGPFESLHTSKMLVGMRDVTVNSRSDMKWLHLAAGARFVSEMVKREKTEVQKVADQLRKYKNED